LRSPPRHLARRLQTAANHSINHQFLDLECGINRVAVRSTETPGDITIAVHGAGLQPASITLPSRNFQRRTVTRATAAAAATAGADQAGYDGAQAMCPPQRKRTRGVTSPPFHIPAGGGVHVERDARDGAKIYADRDLFSAVCRRRWRAATGCRPPMRTNSTARWTCWIFR